MNWTPQQLQQLADAYSAKNPTWTPPAEMNAQLPNPIQPTNFNPFADPSYIFPAAGLLMQQQGAQSAYNYGTGTSGPQDFGYGYDAGSGNVFKMDSSSAGYNPYNQAAVLQRNYDNSVRGTNNSYAAQGQLYSGARLNAQAANDYNFNRASDTLQRQAQDYYHGLQQNVDTANSGVQYLNPVLTALQDFLKQQGQ